MENEKVLNLTTLGSGSTNFSDPRVAYECKTRKLNSRKERIRLLSFSLVANTEV